MWLRAAKRELMQRAQGLNYYDSLIVISMNRYCCENGVVTGKIEGMF